jgi:hypothetical protein
MIRVRGGEKSHPPGQNVLPLSSLVAPRYGIYRSGETRSRARPSLALTTRDHDLHNPLPKHHEGQPWAPTNIGMGRRGDHTCAIEFSGLWPHPPGTRRPTRGQKADAPYIGSIRQ